MGGEEDERMTSAGFRISVGEKIKESGELFEMIVDNYSKLFRQNDVLLVDGMFKQRRNLLVRESGDAAVDY